MKKRWLFWCLFIGILFPTIAQDDDYVITPPKKQLKSDFNQLDNPDYTNYLLSASCFTLKKRDIRISNTDLVFSKVSYGLTDNTTASMSISLIGGLVASIKQQIHIADETRLGFSASFGQIAALPTDSTVLFAGGQAMITLGNHQDNITFGLGFYYAKSSFELIGNETNFLLNNIYLAGQKRLGRRVYFIAEGIYFNSYNILSGTMGVKITIKETMTIGAGVMSLAWIDPITRNVFYAPAGSLLPLLSFRMLLDRH